MRGSARVPAIQACYVRSGASGRSQILGGEGKGEQTGDVVRPALGGPTALNSYLFCRSLRPKSDDRAPRKSMLMQPPAAGHVERTILVATGGGSQVRLEYRAVSSGDSTANAFVTNLPCWKSRCSHNRMCTKTTHPLIFSGRPHARDQQAGNWPRG